MPGLLVLFALKEEAGPSRRAPLPAQVLVFGAGPAGVAAAADALRRDRPDAVLHAGFAGALAPDAAVGDAFRISELNDDRGSVRIPRTPHGEGLASLGLPAARLFTVREPLGRPGKLELARDDAADLVDMESAGVARACADLGIPWTGLRIVSDGLEDELPPELLAAWDGRRFRTARLLRGCLSRPGLLPELLALRSRSKRLASRLAELLGKLLAS